MKNLPKNNYSKKHNNTEKRRSRLKNNNKSNSFKEDRFNLRRDVKSINFA